MKRGRPKGSGKRWTNRAHVHLWAELEFIMWRDGHRDARRAARTYLYEGNFQLVIDQSNPRLPPRIKVWHSRTAKHPMPQETLRKEYQTTKRRYASEPAFRADCDFELAFRKERHDTDDSVETIITRLKQ